MSEELAKKAYLAYGQTTDFKNYQGLPMPEWLQPCREIFPAVPQVFNPKNKFKIFLTLGVETRSQFPQLKIKSVDAL